jgi:uncharacterized protein YjbI with pentapeptide repeats
MPWTRSAWCIRPKADLFNSRPVFTAVHIDAFRCARYVPLSRQTKSLLPPTNGRDQESLVTIQRRATMFTKILLAAAVLAATAAAPAHACLSGCGLKFNGKLLNGISLNGPGNVFQGVALNGIKLQGWSLNGIKLQGRNFNGLTLNRTGLNVGGHEGVSLNGQVIAIEF